MNIIYKRQYLYLFVLILGIIMLYPKDVYADKPDLVTCKYSNSDKTTQYSFTINEDYTLDWGTAKILYFNSAYINKKKDPENWSNVTVSGEELLDFSILNEVKEKSKDEACPGYLIIRKNKVFLGHSYLVYGFYEEKQQDAFLKYLDKIGANDDSLVNLSLKTEEVEIPAEEPEPITTCEKVLGSGKGSVAELLQKLFNYIKVLGPILVILFSALDFTKTILTSDDDAMKKSQKKLGIRLACAVGIYFLPMIATLIINLVFGTSGDQICGIK